MKKIYKKIIFIFSLLCFYFSSNATHIVGGELYYQWLGNFNYRITLVVYRDCYFGVPPFDPIGCVGIFDVNNTLISNLQFPVDADSVLLPPAINSPCFIAPTDVCYEKAFYNANIHLPLLQGGYQLAYQRCCRNNSINNIQNPGATGITIYATIPGDPLLAINSNPVFDTIAPSSPDSSTLPPSFACVGIPFVFDNSAIDADGDSLVYELCNPYEGLNTINPGPTCPDPPPYNLVIWQTPYSLSNLLGGTPMTINSQTGLLTATPNTIGQFVIGICVNEYRAGVFVSKTRRDYQLNVVPCPTLIVSAFLTPIIHCGDSTVLFQNNSIGATSYQWYFGDPTTLADSSHAINPTYTYPDTGTYTVTLIAHLNPTCADTAIGIVHIYPPFNADFSFTDSLCSYKIFFTDTSSNNGSGVTSGWNWKFGDAATSNIHNPSHNYTGPGNYNVTFIATSSLGCKDTVTKVVTVDSLPSATVSLQLISCHGDSNATATAHPKGGTMPYTFLWSNGQTTQTATNLFAGTYTVTVADSNNCVATKVVTITQPAVLTSTLKSTDDYCKHLCIGTATVTPAGGTPPYTYSWNDPLNQQTQTATHLCEGKYTVIITDSHGCKDTASVTVNYSDYIPPLNATVSNDTIYEGQTALLGSTIYSNTIYTWMPSAFLTNPNIPGPSVTINTVGIYVYVIEISDTLGCRNSDSVRIVVSSTNCVEPEIFIPNAFTPNDDGNNDILYVRGNLIKELLLRVYDRWGEKVFETNIPGMGWNGTFKGKPVQPGVYDYYLNATCYNNEKFFKKGNVTVIK